MTFNAFRVENDGLNQGRLVKRDLPELRSGFLHIDAVYSSLNYKDALAVTGKGKILRQYPLCPGIDVSGVVRQSMDSRYRPGDAVLVTGCGLGETQDGGFAEQLQVPADWVLPLPETLSLREAMIYGTAGFTAGLCLHRLLTNDQEASLGPIVVTGASGGVGSLAVAMLSQLGFEVLAVSGKAEQKDFLRSLGARDVVSPEQLDFGKKPLESVRYGGAIDNVGGSMLEGLLRHTNLWGNIASVGLAGGHAYSSTVMPFILRGVSILGISSNNCPMHLRKKIWQKLAKEWRFKSLETFVSQEIGLADIVPCSEAMIARQSFGRTLVRLQA
ncbi:MAG: YhdH/YhfP family quinone oxidoreductase [Proteobacteria bacterium]|nr:YhdH/YhfP family quinone oxidoreductase [Pseudomonadota bacterium]